MALSVEEANFVGFFMETAFWGVLLVSTGHCLRLLLFQPDRLVLKHGQDIRWWAVGVTALMTIVSTMDLALNLRLNMQAFLWAPRYGTTADVLNDIEGWSNIMRYVLYIIQVLIADGILVFRLFVVHGRQWILKTILLGLFVPAGIAGAVVITVFGVARHDLGGTIPKYTEIALFAVDVLFNAFATSLIVHKLWKTRSQLAGTPAAADKWLLLIRIVVESGLVYMLSVSVLMVADLLGNLNVCVGDAVGQVIAIATILIIIRTHDALRKGGRSHHGQTTGASSSSPATSPTDVFSTIVPLSTTGNPVETRLDLPTSSVVMMRDRAEKAPDARPVHIDTLDLESQTVRHGGSGPHEGLCTISL